MATIYDTTRPATPAEAAAPEVILEPKLTPAETLERLLVNIQAAIQVADDYARTLDWHTGPVYGVRVNLGSAGMFLGQALSECALFLAAEPKEALPAGVEIVEP